MVSVILYGFFKENKFCRVIRNFKRSGLKRPFERGDPKGLSSMYVNLNITKAAKFLGVTRENLSSIVNGRTGIYPEMALCLSKTFQTDAEMWLNLQKDYDLWQVEQRAGDLLKEVQAVP